MTHVMLFKTRWGWVGMAGSEKGITGIVLSGNTRRAAMSALRPRQNIVKNRRDDTAVLLLQEARAQVLDYLGGKRQDFSVRLDLSKGTPFQRRVWRTILRIPYGRVRSYQWVAVRVGGRQYARAVGMALGANPVPLVVPCHRVIAHDGSLGGFSCGMHIKRRLLRLEGTLPRLQRV